MEMMAGMNIYHEHAKLAVYDMTGRKKEENRIQAGNNHFKIDVSGYAEGTYVIIIQASSGVRFREKFVVAR